jgi:hypothetical protein
MSDYGKSKGKGGRGEKKGSRSSHSVKAGLVFPVGRTSRKLRKGKYANRIGIGAAIYLAAVLVSSNPTHISTFRFGEIRFDFQIDMFDSFIHSMTCILSLSLCLSVCLSLSLSLSSQGISDCRDHGACRKCSEG